MSRKVKKMMVSEMADRFADLQEHGCVLVGYRGLSANQAANVRSQLAKEDAEMMVVRNRLFRIALEQLGMLDIEEVVDGPTAVVTGEDPVQAAKAIDEATEIAPELSVFGGYAEGKVLSPEEVEKLMELPDRETLLSQVLAGMSAPAQQFVNCLNGALLRLGSVLRQVKDQREEEESE